jgi:Flp pilus assembly pilin Flp
MVEAGCGGFDRRTPASVSDDSQQQARAHKLTDLGRARFIMKSCLIADEGQAMVEYALILALVALVCVGTLSLFSGPLNTIFNAVHAGF